MKDCSVWEVGCFINECIYSGFCESITTLSGWGKSKAKISVKIDTTNVQICHEFLFVDVVIIIIIISSQILFLVTGGSIVCVLVKSEMCCIDTNFPGWSLAGRGELVNG